jgi:hypothetical protein
MQDISQISQGLAPQDDAYHFRRRAKDLVEIWRAPIEAARKGSGRRWSVDESLGVTLTFPASS